MFSVSVYFNNPLRTGRMKHRVKFFLKGINSDIDFFLD